MRTNAKLVEPPRLKGIPSSEEAATAKRDHLLYVLGLMTSRKCNLRCTYCYTAAGRAVPGELPTQERLRVLQEAAKIGARLLWIPGEGEPLLDDSFWPLVDRAAQLGLWVLFYTSGSLITRDIARRIESSPCSVVVKLNSLQPEVQDEMAGMPGAAVAIRRGIDLLLSTGLAGQQRLAAETVVTPSNKTEMSDLLRFCRSNKLIPYIERLLPTGRGANPALHLDRAREEEIFTTLAQVDRDEFGYDWDVHEMFACDLWDCERILYSTVVDSVGRVHPCVAIRHVLGDVHHDNLSAIWQKQRATYSKESLSPWAGQGVCYCRLFSQESSAVERLIEVR